MMQGRATAQTEPVGSTPAVAATAAAPLARDARPLVMHVVYRFAVGGLENGVVNLINRLPADEFRHAIVALTACDPAFCRRIERDDVEYVSLEKPPGHGFSVYASAWRLFRERKPAIVHTRNLAALEMQVPALAAGVPVRIHGEHGRDMSDPDGKSRKYRIMRRAYSPFVTHYVTVSADLERYLRNDVGASARKIVQIYNGVDERKFRPAEGVRADEPLVVGTVGRLQEIKGQPVLVAAVARLLERLPEAARRLRVRLVGDGPLRATLEREIATRNLGNVVELAGERSDVADVMRGFDVFVLPSLGEGISNTILEAMACGLPVVATAVGGNTELVAHGETGTLVPPNDADALAAALAAYLEDPALRRRHGNAARDVVERRFALERMVERYRALYRDALRARAPHQAAQG